MKVRMKHPILLKGLQKCLGIPERKTSIPVLGGMLIRADQEKVNIIATNGEMDIVSIHDAEIESAGEIVLPGKKLFEIVREIESESVTLSVSDNHQVIIEGGKVKYKIKGLAAEEFPQVFKTDDVTTFNIPAPALRDLINWTSYAVSTDELRIHLNGTYLELEEDGDRVRRLKMTATDGHRLVISYSEPNQAGDFDLSKGVIIPRKALAEIRKLVDDNEDDIEVAVEDGRMIVITGNTVLTVRLIDADYPDYRRIQPLPEDKGTLLVFKKDGLLHILRRMSVLSSDLFNGMYITLEESCVRFDSTNPDLGEVTEEIEVPHEGIGSKIGCNVSYLMDAVKTMKGDDLILEIKGRNQLLVRPMDCDQYFCLIMGLKI